MMEYPALPYKSYQQIRHEIKSGDILLCSGNGLFSDLIRQATNSIWSHVAFILRLDVIDRIFVLESVESIGVRAVPLSSYVRDYNGTGKGYPGRLMIARHQHLDHHRIKDLSKFAVDLLGHPYHKEEIVRIAARISMNNIGLPNADQDALPQREFICSEYAHVCFKSIGIDIQYNPLGFIAPVDFARCPQVTPLNFIEVEGSEINHEKQNFEMDTTS